MKTTTLSYLLVAALGLLVWSCANDNPIAPSSNDTSVADTMAQDIAIPDQDTQTSTDTQTPPQDTTLLPEDTTPPNDTTTDASLDAFPQDTTPTDTSEPPPPEDPRVTDFLAGVSRRYLDSFVDPAGTPAVWSEGNLLEALTVLYDATGDHRILDELTFHIDALLASTSTALGRPDELRGTPVAAWPTGNYSCGFYYAHAVHTGVLAYPIAWFARRALEDPAIAALHGARIQPYLNAARDAIDVLDGELKTSGSRSWYVWANGLGAALGNCDGQDWAAREGTELPYNQMITPARAMIHLAAALELDGQSPEPYRGNAIGIARHFESRWDYRSDIQAYEWLYAVGGRPEDTSHGSIDARFVAQIYDDGLHFNATHLERFANTFTELLAIDPDHVRSHLSETYGGTYERRWQSGIVRWLSIAPWAPSREVYDLSRYIYFNAEGSSQLGWALLLLHAPDAYTYPAWVRSWSTLPVENLRGSMQPSSDTGLYRTSGSPLVDVSGVTVSSCAHWEFETDQTGPLTLRYRHTADPISGDSCSGNACGTAPGFIVFSSMNGTSWTRVSGIPAPQAETWSTEVIDMRTAPWRHILGCRSGSGHARDNIQVKMVRTGP